MTANEKTWTQWEAELDETFRKWAAARDYTLTTSWKRDAAGKRRAMRVASDVTERRVTLNFTWRIPTSAQPERRVQIITEKRDRAVDNLAAIAKACEWLRMAEVRGIAAIITVMWRQMNPTLARDTGAASGAQQGSQQGQRPPLSSGPYAVLHVTNDAPLAVAEAAYRAALRQAHPDTGGDHERAKVLNAAIAAIRLERAAEYANRK